MKKTLYKVIIAALVHTLYIISCLVAWYIASKYENSLVIRNLFIGLSIVGGVSGTGFTWYLFGIAVDRPTCSECTYCDTTQSFYSANCTHKQGRDKIFKNDTACSFFKFKDNNL